LDFRHWTKRLLSFQERFSPLTKGESERVCPLKIVVFPIATSTHNPLRKLPISIFSLLLSGGDKSPPISGED
jgi:hypothetical protein